MKKIWLKRYIWLSIGAVNSQMFLVASALSWTSSAIPKMNSLSLDDEGNLGYSFVCGTGIGGIFTFITLIYLSKKISLLTNELILLTSWIFLLFKDWIGLVIFGRLLAGIASSSIALNLSVYEAECFHPGDTIISSGIIYIFTAAGLFFEDSIAPFITNDEVVIINIVVICIFLITYPWYGFETPIDLIKKGKFLKARKTMHIFWGKDSNRREIDEEFFKLKSLISAEKKIGPYGIFKSIFSGSGNMRVTILAIILIALYNSSGYLQVSMYLEPILVKANKKEINPKISSAVVGVFKLIGVMISILAIKYLGEKKTLLFTMAINSLCLLLLGGYFFTHPKSFFWFPTISLSLFTMPTITGSSIVPFLHREEMLPMRLMGPEGATTDLISSAFALLATYMYIKLSTNYIYLPFWIFGATTMLHMVIVQFYVPEKDERITTIHDRKDEGRQNTQNKTNK